MPAAERETVWKHLRGCDRCRELSALAASEPGEPVAPPADLAAAILEKTSGSTCDRARHQLCARLDDGLEAVDDELVRMHVDACAECAAVELVLARMAVDLPLLAELDPDAGFLREVLQRTASLPAAGWAARLTAGWERLLTGPRLALEGAYLGMFAIMLIFGTPGSPLAEIPRKALELVKINPVAELKQPVADLAEEAVSRAGFAWRTTSLKMNAASREIAENAKHASDSASDLVGTLWDQLASEQETDETEPSNDDGNRTQGNER